MEAQLSISLPMLIPIKLSATEKKKKKKENQLIYLEGNIITIKVRRLSVEIFLFSFYFTKNC